MRICMLAYTHYDSDERVRQYAEALAKRGDHVDIIALRKKGQINYEVLNDVNVYRIQRRIRNERKKTTYLAKILLFFANSACFITKKSLRNAYQLIHVHSVPDFEVFATVFAKLLGAKIILDIHDIVPEFYAGKFDTKKNSPLFKLLVFVEKISIAFSHRVIIANDIWKKTLTSRSVKKEKCTALINYPNPYIFYKRPRLRNDGRYIIIYPGTLNWHQGVDIAIKAVALIKDDIPEAEFHIYGEGPEKENIEKLTSFMGLENRVFFKGYLPTDKIANKMAEADLGVVPKRASGFGNEAFSTKSLQFMSLGIPVIVSNTKIDKYYFNESFVKFFESGNEKDLAKCIIQLRNNAELRKMNVINALQFVEKNNWEVKKNIYLDLVDSLVDNTGCQ